MRTLFVRTMNLLLRFRIGRWAAALLFLALGLVLLFDPSSAGKDVTTALVTGAVALVIGAALLIFTVRLELLLRKKKQTEKASLARANELIASGKVLAIPPLPKTPLKGVSEDTLLAIEQYALRMANLPWGEHPRIATVEEAYPIFNRIVGRVREITGDWASLSEPIGVFVALPKPLCYVGAAEVMLRLSYIRSDLWAPVGLRQGLRFVARSQYYDPEQPDALVIRIKLLVGYASDLWLRLAEETLEMLKAVAPGHPRLPDAEASILVRRGKLEEALACIETFLASPPSREEVHMALSRKAGLLDRMKRSEDALAAYDLVNEHYPQDPWAWHNKSIILMNLGHYRQALACNGRALSIMDFGAARSTGERIRAKIAEAQGSSPL